MVSYEPTTRKLWLISYHDPELTYCLLYCVGSPILWHSKYKQPTETWTSSPVSSTESDEDTWDEDRDTIRVTFLQKSLQTTYQNMYSRWPVNNTRENYGGFHKGGFLIVMYPEVDRVPKQDPMKGALYPSITLTTLEIFY